MTSHYYFCLNTQWPQLEVISLSSRVQKQFLMNLEMILAVPLYCGAVVAQLLGVGSEKL